MKDDKRGGRGKFRGRKKAGDATTGSDPLPFKKGDDGSAPAETPNSNTPPEPIVLKSRRDVTLVEVSLERRESDLTKLAEKNDAEGYPRAAAQVRADALAIKHDILPKVRTQREIQFPTPTQVADAVEAVMSAAVHKAFRKLTEKDGLPIDAQLAGREKELLAHLVGRVTTFAEKVAAEAYAAGVAARENSPEMVVLRHVSELKEVTV